MGGTGIIYMANPGDVNAALFHTPDRAMREYIGNSVQQYVDIVKHTAPEFAATIKNRFQEISSSAAVQYVKNIKNRIKSLWQVDGIRYLSTVEKIQQAPDSMHRYIMALPELRSLYQNGGCSAFDKKYVDTHPDTVGWMHYDYRRVTDGVVMQKEDGTVGYTNYYESNIVEEDILTVMQKNSIMGTWNVIRSHLENDGREDPTSPWNGTL